jgi:hypothetical protein
MSDFEFESRLERMFSQPPPVTDPGVFAAQVQARLERGWALRRMMIWVAGLTGGSVAASQAFGSGILARLNEVNVPVSPLLQEAGSPGRLLASDGLGAALAGGGEVLWIAAALLAVTVGIAATQLSDAF